MCGGGEEGREGEGWFGFGVIFIIWGGVGYGGFVVGGCEYGAAGEGGVDVGVGGREVCSWSWGVEGGGAEGEAGVGECGEGHGVDLTGWWWRECGKGE